MKKQTLHYFIFCLTLLWNCAILAHITDNKIYLEFNAVPSRCGYIELNAKPGISLDGLELRIARYNVKDAEHPLKQLANIKIKDVRTVGISFDNAGDSDIAAYRAYIVQHNPELGKYVGKFFSSVFDYHFSLSGSCNDKIPTLQTSKIPIIKLRTHQGLSTAQKIGAAVGLSAIVVGSALACLYFYNKKNASATAQQTPPPTPAAPVPEQEQPPSEPASRPVPSTPEAAAELATLPPTPASEPEPTPPEPPVIQTPEQPQATSWLGNIYDYFNNDV